MASEEARIAPEEDTRRKIIQRRKQEEPLYYRDYLRVQDLLTLQQPRSREAGAEAHDELLFIIVHQAYELWFKQILHEIDSVREIFAHPPVNERLVGVAVARLQRVTVIQNLLLQQVAVIETMRPVDFLDFRDYLYPASGFQSVQFRLVENRLGLRPSERIRYGEKQYCSYLAGEDARVVEDSEQVPSLHDLVEAWLERTPFLEMATGEVVGPSVEDAAVQASGSVSEAGNSTGTGVGQASPTASSAPSATFTWWEHYKEAVTSMLEADEAAILAHPALSTNAIAGAPPGAQQGAGSGPTTREIALRDLAATRKHFDTVMDEKQYEAARARGERRLSYRAMQAALLITLYSDEPILQLPARLLSMLLDIDENMTAWRHRHALMVHRMLGVKMGTGGSSGYHYLRATAERHRVFTDMFNLSTFLIPRQLLPPLPRHVRAKLGFAFADPNHAMSPAVPGRAGGRVPGLEEGEEEDGRRRYRPQLGSAFASLTASLGHISLHEAPGVPGPVPGQAAGSLVAGVGAHDVTAAQREASVPAGHPPAAAGATCPFGHGSA